MIYQIVGLFVLTFVVLNIIVFFRGWKKKIFVPLSFLGGLILITPIIVGFLIGPMISENLLVSICLILDFVYMVCAAVVLVWMLLNKPTVENKAFFTQCYEKTIKAIDFKKWLVLIGLTFLIFVIICLFQGLFQIDGEGTFYNFIFLISLIIAGIILKLKKKN